METKLLNIASEFLTKEKIVAIENSIEYLGFRKSMDMRNGEIRDVHIVGFLSDFNNDSIDGIRGGTVYITADTNKVLLFVTPHFMMRYEQE